MVCVLVIGETDVNYWRNDSNFRLSWKVAFHSIRGYKNGNHQWKKLWYMKSFAYHRPRNAAEARPNHQIPLNRNLNVICWYEKFTGPEGISLKLCIIVY